MDSLRLFDWLCSRDGLGWRVKCIYSNIDSLETQIQVKVKLINNEKEQVDKGSAQAVMKIRNIMFPVAIYLTR